MHCVGCSMEYKFHYFDNTKEYQSDTPIGLYYGVLYSSVKEKKRGEYDGVSEP